MINSSRLCNRVWTTYCTDGNVWLSLSKLISRAAQTQSRILISVDRQSPIICRSKGAIKRFLIGNLSRYALCETCSLLSQSMNDKLQSAFKSIALSLLFHLIYTTLMIIKQSSPFYSDQADFKTSEQTFGIKKSWVKWILVLLRRLNRESTYNCNNLYSHEDARRNERI